MAEHVAPVASVAPPVAPGEPHSPQQPVRRVSVPALDLPSAETRSEGGINSPRAGAVPKSRSELLLSQLNDPESPPAASPGRAANSGAYSPPSGEADGSPEDAGAGKGSEAAPAAGAASRLALPSFPSLLSFATAGAAPEAPEETDAERTARRLQARFQPARACCTASHRADACPRRAAGEQEDARLLRPARHRGSPRLYVHAFRSATCAHTRAQPPPLTRALRVPQNLLDDSFICALYKKIMHQARPLPPL
jgi:hypothetical protein